MTKLTRITCMMLTLLTMVASVSFAQMTDEDKKAAADKQAALDAKIKSERDADAEGWTIGAGIGLDLSVLTVINPRAGAGENRIGLGSNTSIFANYRKGRLAIDNTGGLSLAIQRLGRGENIPFTKNIDLLNASSKTGYQASENSKFFYSLLVTFQSQLLPTYPDNELGNRDDITRKEISKFLSPANIGIAPGIDYKHDEHLSVFFSPAAIKLIVVADDSIAIRGVDYTGSAPVSAFGLELDDKNNNGLIEEGEVKNLDFQVGGLLRATYQNKFFNDRVAFQSVLSLYSNYLRDPQNIDVEWTTQTNFVIFKGISVAFTTGMYYDHDILVNFDKDGDVNTGVNGYEAFGRRIHYTQQLTLQYNHVF